MKPQWILGLCLLAAGCGQTGDPAGGPVASPASAPSAATSPTPVGGTSDGAAGAPAGDDIAGEPTRGIIAQKLAYGALEDRNLTGFFAMPEDVIEPLPGVVMIHDASGLNDSIRDSARRLAAEGYAVLAVDLYGGTVATDSAEAEQLMSRLLSDRDAALSNLRQAQNYLAQYALAPQVAVLGWSLGGGLALQAGLDLVGQFNAVVMYYGDIEYSESRLRLLDVPLLGIFAEGDRQISVRDAQAFRTHLRDLGKDADVFIYSNVGHAFADPDAPTFDPDAAGEAWAATLEFLDRHLAPATPLADDGAALAADSAE